MALSPAQLNTIYQNVLFRNADVGGIQFFANRTDISDAQVRQQIELSTEANQFISPIVRLYQTVLGRVPDQDGLRFFSFQLRQGTTLEAVTGALLASAEFRAKTTATAGSVDLTDTAAGATNQLISDTFQAILGRTPAPGELTFFQGRSAASILSLVAGSPEAVQVNAAASLTFLDSVAQGSYPTGTLNNQTGGVGGGTNPGTTFTLTAGVDAGSAFTGGSAADTFNAGDVNGTAVFTTGDQLNGGAGADTLNITTANAFAGIPTGASISNIETINLVSGSTVTFNATTGSVTGLTALNVTSVGGADVTTGSTTDTKVVTTALPATAGGLKVNGGQNVVVQATGTADAAGVGGNEIQVGLTTAATGTVTVSNSFNGADNAVQGDVAVTGGTTINVTETLTNAGATTNTQGNVTIVGSTATTSVTVTQDKAATAAAATGTAAAVAGKVNGTVSITDVNAASNTAAGSINAVTLNSFGASSAINSSALTTLNLTGSGADLTVTQGALTTAAVTTQALNVNGLTTSGAVTLGAPITTLNVSSSGTASTIQTLAAAGVQNLNISGDAKLTLTNDTFAALQNVVVTNTGGVTLGTALAADTNFTGGAGADTITLTGGFTKAITLGGGNDTVTYGGVAGTGGSVNAGEGTDTIVMTAAQAALADDSAVFNSKFTGFEVLSIATGANGQTLTLAGLNGVNNVTTLGATNLTLDGFGANGTLTLTGASTSVVANVTNATFNPSDVFNINLSNGTTSTAFGSVTAAGVETININTIDAGTGSLTAATIDTLTLVANSATSIVVAGNNGLNITNNGGNTAVTSFNASGVVANSTNDTAANLAVTFTSVNDTASANVSITGGAGNDVLTGGAAKDTIVGGAGNDILSGGAGIDNLSGGDGDDFLDGGADADILSGGAGTDTFVVSTLNNVTATTTLIVDTITDLNFGVDRIALDKAVTAVTTIDTPITATNLLGAAQTALATIGASANADVYKAGTFSFNGDTYLLVNDNNTTLDNTDFLVKVTNATGTLSVNSFGTVINGTAAADTLNGTAFSDTINGLGAGDTIRGFAGNDTLNGGEGADSLRGDGGNDTIILTETVAASDTVIFEATAAGNGRDTITGFAVGATGSGGDVLNVKAFITGGVAQNGGSGAAITAFTAASASAVDIDGQVAVFSNGGTPLTATSLIAQFGGGKAFDATGGGKHVIIEGNAGSAADAVVWYVDSSLDGTAGTYSAADAVAVGTVGSINISNLVTGNFVAA